MSNFNNFYTHTISEFNNPMVNYFANKLLKNTLTPKEQQKSQEKDQNKKTEEDIKPILDLLQKKEYLLALLFFIKNMDSFKTVISSNYILSRILSASVPKLEQMIKSLVEKLDFKRSNLHGLIANIIANKKAVNMYIEKEITPEKNSELMPYKNAFLAVLKGLK